MRRIKIVKKNLRDYYGYAYTNLNKIEIDPRLPSRQYLNTLIHEILHILYPKDSETRISKNADTLCHYIWEEQYRKISK